MSEKEKDTQKKRRIFAGYYKRYDGGLHFYVKQEKPKSNHLCSRWICLFYTRIQNRFKSVSLG